MIVQIHVSQMSYNTDFKTLWLIQKDDNLYLLNRGDILLMLRMPGEQQISGISRGLNNIFSNVELHAGPSKIILGRLAPELSDNSIFADVHSDSSVLSL